MLQTVTSAFFLGLLSSLHCVGMCGPLLLALPNQRLGPAGRAFSSFFYHGGRILTYTLGGLVFGLAGHHLYLAGWQQGLSIALGAAILMLYIIRRLPAAPSLKLPPRLMRRIGGFWQSPTLPGFFLLGVANGLLPCGMVYLAIAAALLQHTVTQAILFMAFFGAGTLPLLLGTQYLGRKITANWRIQLRRTLPIVTVLMAVLLILRGLNLGIPFISPVLAAAPKHPISCH
ncbi:MAG TPA: sulfite exporter TauE/SafE family protein [Puia sp.]|nr:sulfite exporter TauE/SafE family protein [Puia sp.]